MHYRDGLYFYRNDDGSVSIVKRDPLNMKLASAVEPSEALDKELGITRIATIPRSEWASILASVSRQGESAEQYNRAVELHG